ncbi:MAG: transcription antitermination factor NusB [Ruminococcaceae bacterium]|nr:transcription antitermination factor NusB [Oscillospiraceae bacterium]
MERRKAREAVLALLFEREFKKEEDPALTVRLAEENRDIKADDYVERVYFGVMDHRDEIDGLITSRSIGWKTNRMTKISLTVMRIAVYEMKYCEDIPFSVSINEAVELTKRFDDEKAPAFVNGVLNGVAEDLGLKGDAPKA